MKHTRPKTGATIFALFLLSAMLATAGEPKPLTLKEAREIALKKHPKITVVELKALAARQSVREARAGFLPNLSLNAGVVGATHDSTRIVGTGLTVSSVFDRASVGASFTQLVTDFGRTANLTESSKLRARAEEQNVEATRAQLWLQVDAAYLGGLQAQAVRQVAVETVKTRQLLRDQVSALASNQLKSELDASFAEVALQEARLALTRADNDVQSAHATLAALLDSRDEEVYQLAEELMPGVLSGTSSDMVRAALRDRPDLQRFRLERDSADKFARAERGLSYPTLSIQGTAGVIPERDSALNQDYAAAGVVFNWPLYSGGAYAARHEAARLRAEAADAALKDEENNVVRDVRIAWLNANNAGERLGVAEKLLEQARKSYVLADARYKVGSSSIVELSQAQVSQTSAEVTYATARFEYLLRRSILEYQAGGSHYALQTNSK
jgi:outer membrane protein